MHSPFKLAHFLAIAGIACGSGAHAAIVTPASLGNWSPAPFGGGSTAISSTFPRSGSGSVEITLPDGSAGVDWTHQLTVPVALSTFTGGAYEYWRASASTNPAIQAPAYALLIDNDCSAATTADQAYLVYEPYYQTPAVTALPTDQWVGETITPASVVWPIEGVVPWSSQPLSSYMNNSASGGTAIRGTSCILAVVPFAGSGWVGAFHGAIDNVRLAAGGIELVNANFEPSPPTAPVPVPTLSQWGLGLMVLLLGAMGFQRSRRASAKV